jgi:hypothetical protein
MELWERLAYVDMKTRRAKVHLDSLQAEIDAWLVKPYIVSEHTDLDNALHIFTIELAGMHDIIPMLIGDYVCCLRSSLDQLAWQLAHLALPDVRQFTDREERLIHFPIARYNDSTYLQLRGLFPATVASVMDDIQPYLRGNAYRDDLLWQLNELWTMDKHRAIPMNGNSLQIWFPIGNWMRFMRHLEYGIEVRFPLALSWACQSKVKLAPRVTVDVLFGEHMGTFEVSRTRLTEIYNFVRNDVIPKFARFFAQTPNTI